MRPKRDATRWRLSVFMSSLSENPRKMRAKRVSYVYSDSDSEIVEVVPKKRKRSKISTSVTDEHAETLNAHPSSAGILHPSSLHMIKEPVQLRSALTKWYNGVHDKRGMPWRKAFDASFTRAQRSQRAYEVGSSIPIICAAHCIVRYGSRR